MITRIVALAALGVLTNSVSGGDGRGGNPETALQPADRNKVPAADAARLQQALLDVSGVKAPGDLSGRGFVLPASWNPTPPPASGDDGKSSGTPPK